MEMNGVVHQRLPQGLAAIGTMAMMPRMGSFHWVERTGKSETRSAFDDTAVAFSTHLDQRSADDGRTSRQRIADHEHTSASVVSKRLNRPARSERLSLLRTAEQVGALPSGWSARLWRHQIMMIGWDLAMYEPTVDACHWPALREIVGRLDESEPDLMVLAGEALVANALRLFDPGCSGLEPKIDHADRCMGELVTAHLCRAATETASDDTCLRSLLAALTIVFPTVVSGYAVTSPMGWRLLPAVQASIHAAGRLKTQEAARTDRTSWDRPTAFEEIMANPPEFMPTAAPWVRSMERAFRSIGEKGWAQRMCEIMRQRLVQVMLPGRATPRAGGSLGGAFSNVADCDRRAALWAYGESCTDRQWKDIASVVEGDPCLGGLVDAVSDARAVSPAFEQLRAENWLWHEADQGKLLDCFFASLLEGKPRRGDRFEKNENQRLKLLALIREIVTCPSELRAAQGMETIALCSDRARRSCALVIVDALHAVIDAGGPQFAAERCVRAIGSWEASDPECLSALEAVLWGAQQGLWSEGMLTTVALALSELVAGVQTPQSRQLLAFLGELAVEDRTRELLAAYLIARAAAGDTPSVALTVAQEERARTELPGILQWAEVASVRRER